MAKSFPERNCSGPEACAIPAIEIDAQAALNNATRYLFCITSLLSRRRRVFPWTPFNLANAFQAVGWCGSLFGQLHSWLVHLDPRDVPCTAVGEGDVSSQFSVPLCDQ